MTYNVRIQVFDGPFDLLLHLIKINEMDIYDIKIAEITQQYLDYLKAMEKLDLEIGGDFILMAATLIQIKTRTLLPEPSAGEEEEEEIDAIFSAKELFRQLIEYRQIKEVTQSLREKEAEQLKVFYRNNLLPRLADAKEEVPDQPLDTLLQAFSRVLSYVDTVPYQPNPLEPFTVEQKIESLGEMLRTEKSLQLTSLFKRCLNKVEMIVTLLALLELCRLRRARVEQSDNFSEVHIYPLEASQVQDV